MLTFARIDKATLISNKAKIIHALQDLCTNSDDFKDAIGKATRDRARINTRVKLWGDALRSFGIKCPALTYGT